MKIFAIAALASAAAALNLGAAQEEEPTRETKSMTTEQRKKLLPLLTQSTWLEIFDKVEETNNTIDSGGSVEASSSDKAQWDLYLAELAAGSLSGCDA